MVKEHRARRYGYRQLVGEKVMEECEWGCHRLLVDHGRLIPDDILGKVSYEFAAL